MIAGTIHLQIMSDVVEQRIIQQVRSLIHLKVSVDIKGSWNRHETLQ